MSKYLDGEGFEMKSDAPADTVTAYLTGKGKAPTKNVVLDKARFVGESSRVRTMQEDLATIKNSAQEFYDRVNSIPYGVPKVSETSKVGNVDNITKSPTDVNADNVAKTSATKAKRVFSDETLQDVKAISENIKQLEEKHPEFKTTSENLYNFQKEMLKYWVVDTGGMNIDTFNELQERYPHYVPFMRDISRNTKGYKNSFANQQSPIKNARGSGATIISPLESIMRNVEKYVKFGTRNKVMGVLALYADDVSGFANFIEPVPPDQIKRTMSIQGLSDKFLKVMSENLNDNDLYTLTEAFDDIFGTQIESYTPVVIPGKQIVTWLENGEYKYYQIHDKALFDAITNLTPTQADGILNFGAKILGVTNMFITGFNPVFATTNMIRDFDTAMKNSEAYDNPITFTAAYMSALWDVITNSDSYKQYKAAGGGHMSNFSDNINVLKRTLSQVSSKDAGLARRFAQATFLHPIYNLTRLNEITESVPRLAEFKGMKKMGADNQKAIYTAADVTNNYNKSGEVGRKLNKMFRFSNATVQGMDKQVRVFTTGGRKKITKHLLRYLISAIVLTALQQFWNRTVMKLLYVIDKSDNEALRRQLTLNYCECLDIDIFSLSDVDMTTAKDFISWLIELCVSHDIPTNDSLLNITEDIDRYLYLCCAKRRCAVCGKKADIHHVDTVGSGVNRKTTHHLNKEVQPLCRLHHTEAHKIGKIDFNNKYHLTSIKLDEYLCKVMIYL